MLVLLAGTNGGDEATTGAETTGAETTGAGAENDELISALGALGGLNEGGVAVAAVAMDVMPVLDNPGAETLTFVTVCPSVKVEGKVVFTSLLPKSCATGAKPNLVVDSTDDADAAVASAIGLLNR